MRDFYHCQQCGDPLEIGSWPACRGPGSHGSIFRQDALHFQPILVWEQADGSHYYPGNNDVTQVPPGGGKPVFIDTLRKADTFVRETNQREQYDMDVRTEAKRNHADRAQRESRAQLKAELEKRGISRVNVDAICADRDGRGPGRAEILHQFEEVARATGQPFDRERAERQFEQTERTRRNPDYRSRPQARFSIEVFENDSSNRLGHRDESTGWK